MLNDYEKSCLSSFLQVMDDNLLKRMSKSITCGRMECNSRDESINCILLHSDSLMSFFSRRKVGSSLLLNYLNRMQVPVSGDATKTVILEQIFKFWKIPYQPVSQLDCVPSTVSNSVLPSNSSQLCIATSSQDTTQSYNSSLKQMLETKKLIKEVDVVAVDDFVHRFSSQFYELLNTPNASTHFHHNLNSSHFFEKCRVEIIIKGAEEDVQVVVDKCESALKHLSDLRVTHKLLFCPNLSPGAVINKRSCDGLLCVIVCGTLHRTDGVVGQFQQSFILATDPYSQYSYKIQETTLFLKSGEANHAQLLNSKETLALEGGTDIIDVS